MGVVAAVAFAFAYWLGVHGRTTEPIRPTNTSISLSKQIAPVFVPKVAIKTLIETTTVPSISLGKLSDADANEMEIGCQGTFSSKKDDLLYVSGGVLVFRPENRRIIGQVTEKEFEAFNNDDVTAYADGYRLRLVSRGMQKPGYDGHFVDAVLTISKGAKATTYTGTWGVGC